MDSNSRDPGSLRNFSVLLLPHPRVFSRLPTTRPLSSLGEAHRLLRTPEKSSGLRTARPPRWTQGADERGWTRTGTGCFPKHYWLPRTLRSDF